jgi:hypothetical protein
MHIRERFYLADKDVPPRRSRNHGAQGPDASVEDGLASNFRQRARMYDIVEGVCLEGYFKPGVDKDGYAIFIPVAHDVGGNRVPPK